MLFYFLLYLINFLSGTAAIIKQMKQIPKDFWIEIPSSKIFIKIKKKPAYNLPIIVLTDDEVARISEGIKVCNRQVCLKVKATCPAIVKERRTK